MVRSISRWAAASAVLLAGLLATVGLTSPAGAADAPALIRAAHFSPDTRGSTST
ncbi:hypothetical protein [Jatrophihabitans lederbergiae]|uniref:Uncharacterized protein n=1 Tax=Jatrophihabitans lederbergiae TaxID=3075547 RepID=A0ABU2JDS2_9ACTN|nr:hypothetical protein [Jatrophihabitans sp. DSM 44399]MDT0262854.1 hypothetical protein [Jatrophihabitans sp. DSM 44399]